jgi:hypothetical protein
LHAETTDFLRALSGRDDSLRIELISGDAAALDSARKARVLF